MKRFIRIILISTAVLLVSVTVACGQVDTESRLQQSTKKDKPVELTISAAASLKDVIDEIKSDYSKEKINVTITCNFGSAGSLQKQIEQGAEVDIFMSAAAKQMNVLEDKGLIIEDTRKNVLENSIVLIVPKDSSQINDFKDITTDRAEKIGLGEPKSVPVGQYAQEVLTKLDLFDSIKSKVVYGKDVKEVLTWVETGNVDAGIVYKTDAQVSDKVKVVAMAPHGSTSPIYYPAAVIKSTKNVEEAKEFLDYICSNKAKQVFEKYGFKFLLY